MRKRVLITAIVALVVSAAAANAVFDGSEQPQLVTTHSFYVWGDTPRDWVSWADEIAVVDVVGEEQLPLDPNFLEQWVGRRIDATVVERIWTRPGSIGAPASVTLKTTDGWSYRDGDLIPSKDHGSHRSEVGDRLLVAIFHSKDWGWTLMSGGVPVGVDARLHPDADQSDIGERLGGVTLRQLAAIFRSAKPFAEVVRFQHLDPEKKMRAVYEYGQRTRTPAPSG